MMKKHYSPGIPVFINQKKYDGKGAFIYLGNKYKNRKNDNRVTVMIWKKDDAFKFVEIRGRVVGEIPGDDAEKNINDLSHKYWSKPYPFPIQTERIVLKIKADREFFFNLKDDDFEN